MATSCDDAMCSGAAIDGNVSIATELSVGELVAATRFQSFSTVLPTPTWSFAAVLPWE
ncbi:Uncharacterised protein [Mycobacteroides abscessus subsp. abscessus]|nr:Uncharacterised protein [Mycobacteroides abscessus subsp. abscessus]